MKTGLYFQDPKYAVGDVRPDFIFDPSLRLYVPLYQLDGASFMSKDAYGHLYTVTGAIWTPQGGDFDGVDDVINCGAPSAFDITDGITLEIWARGQEGVDIYGLFFSKSSAYYLGIRILDSTRGYLAVRFYPGGEFATAAVAMESVNNWYHIVATYDKSNIVIYRNSEIFETSAQTGAIDVTANNLYIGNLAVGTTYNFDGHIGEVRLYSRALTPLEIQHNYLSTKWRYR